MIDQIAVVLKDTLRIKTRQESLDRIRLHREGRELLRNLLEAVSTTGDLSDEKVLAEFGEQARSGLEALRAKHGGRGASQLRLEEIFEVVLGEFGDKAANLSIKAGDARTDAVAGEIINGLAARALRGENPAALIDEGMAHIEPGSELAGAMRPSGEINFVKLLHRRVTVGSIDRLFAAGDTDAIRENMEDPAVQRALGEKAQRNIFTRLEAFKREQVKISTAPIKGIPRDVFNSLSSEQQAEVLGATPDETTIKGIPESIFDQLSSEEQRRVLGVSDVKKEATVKGIPRDIFDALDDKAQQSILGTVPDDTTIKGIPEEIFNSLSSEEQLRVLGAAPETVKMAPGDVLFEEGEEIASVPAGEKPEKLVEIFDDDSPTKTRLVRESEAEGKPGRERTPIISIINQGKDALADALGKKDAERVDSLESNAQTAINALAEIDRMSAAIESGRFITGVFSDFRVFLARFADFVGASEETKELLGDAATSDTLDAAANRLAVEAASNLGRITNMSLQFIRDSLPSLMRTPEGNRILLEVMRRKAEREIQLATLADEYIQRFSTLRPKDHKTYFQAVRDLDQEDPIITDELRQRIIEGSKSTAPSFKDLFSKKLTISTKEELNALAPGTEFTWGPTGERAVKD